MTRPLWLLAVAGLAGCYNTITPSGNDDDTWRWFSLEGERTWTYESTDAVTPYRLIASKTNDTEIDEGTQRPVHTVTFTYDCLSNSGECEVDTDMDDQPDIEGTVAWVWKMSVTSTQGAFFHAFSDRTRDEVYDPPVMVAGASQAEGESLTTESGGVTFSTTYVVKGLCDAPYWGELMPESCIDFELDDGGAGTPIAGTYQALSEYNIVSFTRAEDGRLWRLRDYDETR